MSFFQAKTLKTNPENGIKIFISKNKYNGCVVIIKPESTCQDILNSNWDEISIMTQQHKTEECFFSMLS